MGCDTLVKSGEGESNTRPIDLQSTALPTELSPDKVNIFYRTPYVCVFTSTLFASPGLPLAGLEPATPSLEGLCANQLRHKGLKYTLAAVGFEPTRANTGHLKCLPLDLLGQTANYSSPHYTIE